MPKFSKRPKALIINYIKIQKAKEMLPNSTFIVEKIYNHTSFLQHKYL